MHFYSGSNKERNQSDRRRDGFGGILSYKVTRLFFWRSVPTLMEPGCVYKSEFLESRLYDGRGRSNTRTNFLNYY
ncbi:hypothetical protein DN745_12630 [Bradymonas sediminis]|uniref:Uncharacterized protein n=1 Tax=Bradymonas sediminis TaxID=1548548 RepID=A0A2Z4FMD5_9DELT|nr:hypothetical protein DN745_12630 [Bradymonas sediminis]